eukprot:Ihof_evm3s152 gene=Ihof_evmTU3s152
MLGWRSTQGPTMIDILGPPQFMYTSMPCGTSPTPLQGKYTQNGNARIITMHPNIIPSKGRRNSSNSTKQTINMPSHHSQPIQPLVSFSSHMTPNHNHNLYPYQPQQNNLRPPHSLPGQGQGANMNLYMPPQGDDYEHRPPMHPQYGPYITANRNINDMGNMPYSYQPYFAGQPGYRHVSLAESSEDELLVAEVLLEIAHTLPRININTHTYTNHNGNSAANDSSPRTPPVGPGVDVKQFDTAM